MSKDIIIQSHKGEYSVSFLEGGMKHLNESPIQNAIYIIDANIVRLYGDKLSNIIDNERILKIEATEINKSLNCFPAYIESLLELNVRRGQKLVAIGGGIIQDVTCFLAATLMRGLPWVFYPTTLLAQADSCIGSKSSINSGDIKNILGTFTPPHKVVIDVDFLKTLEDKDIYSGIGEMLKVHAIDAPDSFNKISDNYQKIIDNSSIMEDFIHSSLSMKKRLIEVDEFDQGARNVMNYGHSFGHAIEVATNYGIPHGVAVTIGMDMANYIAAKLKVSTMVHFDRMHTVLYKNSQLYRNVNIDTDLLMSALSKDKKNSNTQLCLILANKEGVINIDLYDNSEQLNLFVAEYLNKYCGVNDNV